MRRGRRRRRGRRGQGAEDEAQVATPPAVPAETKTPTTSEEDETPRTPTNEAPTTPEAKTQPAPTEVDTPTGEESPTTGEEPIEARTTPIKPPTKFEAHSTLEEGETPSTSTKAYTTPEAALQAGSTGPVDAEDEAQVAATPAVPAEVETSTLGWGMVSVVSPWAVLAKVQVPIPAPAEVPDITAEDEAPADARARAEIPGLAEDTEAPSGEPLAPGDGAAREEQEEPKNKTHPPKPLRAPPSRSRRSPTMEPPTRVAPCYTGSLHRWGTPPARWRSRYGGEIPKRELYGFQRWRVTRWRSRD